MSSHFAFRRLYHAVGTAVVAWAVLEDMVDVFIYEIHTHWGADGIDEIPRTSMARKINLIDRWLAFNHVDEDSKTFLKEHVPQLRKMKTFRDDLIHGVARNVTEYPEKQLLEFHRRTPKNRKLVSVTTTNINLIVRFRKETTLLTRVFGHCTLALVEARKEAQ